MTQWMILGVIVLVIGIIVGNIMLLKYSAKMPFKKSKNQSPDEKITPDD